MAVRSDAKMMVRALELASRGKGHVSPNPLVGAVIARGAKVIGEGYHAGPGKPHAEIVALKQAGSAAKGGTLYVNLEPCCHTGRTGPCTEAIIKAGIKRVVYSLKDPDPRVNGKGIAQLKRAGIEIVGLVLTAEATQLNEFYLFSRKHGRPLVVLKTAQSVDGRIATKSGDSKWISSPTSLKYGHKLRAEIDAVLVGGNTALVDNPSLTVRRTKGRNPYRIVVTTHPERLVDSNLFKMTDNKTIIASTKSGHRKLVQIADTDLLTCWELPTLEQGCLDLGALLSRAYESGIISVLIEGGSELATSFIRAQLVDRYIALVSPLLIGEGVSSVGDLGIKSITEGIKFKQAEWKAFGQDMIFTGQPIWEGK